MIFLWCYIMVTNYYLVFPKGLLTLEDLGDEISFVHSWEEINLCEIVHAVRGSTEYLSFKIFCLKRWWTDEDRVFGPDKGPWHLSIQRYISEEGCLKNISPYLSCSSNTEVRPVEIPDISKEFFLSLVTPEVIQNISVDYPRCTAFDVFSPN